MALSSGKRDEESQPEAKETSWNYDEILDHVGQFGKYQINCFLLFCIPVFFPAWLVMSHSFIAGVPDYRCYVEGCDDSLSGSVFLPDWLNNTAPFDESADGVLKPSHCKIYNVSWESIHHCRQESNDQLDPVACNRWIYDPSVFTLTVVTEFDLTCDNEWKQTFASTIHMLGMLVGAFTLGFTADWYAFVKWPHAKFRPNSDICYPRSYYCGFSIAFSMLLLLELARIQYSQIGRKHAFVLLTTCCGSFALASAFINSFEAYVVLRFFVGMAGVGYFLVLFVWSVEAVGPKYRVTCGFVLQSFYSLGSMALGGIAYYVREWRTLQIIIALPFFVFLLFYFMPESPRWLISKERYPEAEEIIQKAARTNKKTVPTRLMQLELTRQDTTESFDDIFTITQSTTSSQSREKLQPKQNASIVDVFSSFVLCKRVLVIFVAWIAAVLGYYGLTLSATNLAGDFYVNYELSMAVEIPSHIIGIFAMDLIGRRPTLSASLIVCGVACLAAGFVPADQFVVVTTLSLTGKFAISLVYAVLHSYTAELFPTAVRSAVVGMCSTVGRIGGIVSPIIASTNRTNVTVPYLIFGVVTLAAGVLCFALPETRGTKLPDTIEDAETLHTESLTRTRYFTAANPENLKPTA